jgi:hypothetical protein
MLLYLAIQSRINQFRQLRQSTLIALVLLLSVALPSLLSGFVAFRMEEATATASSGGLLLMSDGSAYSAIATMQSLNVMQTGRNNGVQIYLYN